MANVFYAIRNFFRGPGAPPISEGLQSGQPAAYGTSAAAEVNFDSAMQISACWAAVRILSETVASLPFDIYEQTPQGRVPAERLAIRNLLKSRPNRYQTPVEFWESVVLNLAVSGNAYVMVERVSGEIVSLIPVSSQQVETRLLRDGSIIHTYIDGTNVKVFSDKSMWHIKLFGNGIVGMSPLSYARNSLGIAIATDNRVTNMYSNGAKPSGVLTIDKTLTAEQRNQVRAAFSGLEAGSDDRLYVLEAGMQYQQVSMSPKDIEMMDSRRFQIEDIGRFFGVPSILLNQTFGQSSLGSNVFEIMQAFYKINLRPYLEKIESSVIRWLIDDMSAWRKYEVEFDFDALLRADTLSRMQAYREAINTGQLTPNEARELEGRLGLPGGDDLLVQGAMIPLIMAGQQRGQQGGQEPAPQTNTD
jgi:HK97 family phage portal protein